MHTVVPGAGGRIVEPAAGAIVCGRSLRSILPLPTPPRSHPACHLLGHRVCGHPRLFARRAAGAVVAAVLVRVERREVTDHGVVANASLQKSEDRVPVGPEGAAGVPLERSRLRRPVDLNRVSHVVVVDVGRARDDLVRVIGLGL